ncbi:3-dehydroquinate dehydratase [Austwickia chelonae]|uniref:3-dehydroquinate dehydratase n=1 Tax=Austwickia chelonae NBRC 105200 TaxID=1184607 RepID=K6UMF5_9MICO|nr:type II 3-dehydroquinate dehydratase [Austwickia chelonae]GAB78076.1 3-dehydroquinate dehydratase [Austwickia chelonae NBRC 105200]SEV95836.1 3-dehydroquinate dehydratase [Austwickia chelonae]
MTGKIAVLNGPNLGRLGVREPERYGTDTLPEVITRCRALAADRGVELVDFQSNHEGALVDRIEAWTDEGVVGVVVNAGAFTHTSVALRDALVGSGLPFMEVHITNVHAREGFRSRSYLSDVAVGLVVGCGTLGYELALSALLRHLDKDSAHS